MRSAAVLAFLLVSFASAAQPAVDSILNVLKRSAQDTNHVKTLNELANQLRAGNPDTARIVNEQALELSRKLKFKPGIAEAKLSMSVIARTKGNTADALKLSEEASQLFKDLGNRSKLAKAYNVIGSVYRGKGEYYKAIEYFKKSQEICEALGEKADLAQLYNSFGMTYRHLGDISAALDFYFKALKLNEGLNDKIGISKCYTNIGNIYGSKNDMQKTLEYHTKALEAAESVNYKTGITKALLNIGLVYQTEGDPDKALEYILKAIPFQEKAANKGDYAYSLTILADIYSAKKDFAKAYAYSQKSLEIYKAIDDTWGIVRAMMVLADVRSREGDVKGEIKYRNEALALSKEVGLLQEVRDNHISLSKAYEKDGQHKQSLEHYKEYKLYSDSLFNTGSADKLNMLQSKYDAEKREQEILLLKKDNEVKELEGNKNKQRMYFLSGGVVLLLLLSGVAISAYTNKRKANTLLAGQHKEIVTQKSVIEQKNKDITDSINYAKRIQEAILISGDDLSLMFDEYFVLYQPRDIISGDFYWAHKTASGKLMWAAADCTGHGVPGALMSMIGISLLNEIVGQNRIDDPAKVLDELRSGVINALQQKGEAHSIKDGMDIAICSLDRKNNILEYSGAHNPLYIVRSGSKEVEEIKAVKQAVGYTPGQTVSFTKHVREVGPGDTIYVFSDGFADQFGGEKGKKFTYKRFKETLISIQDRSMTEQRTILAGTLRDWKNEQEQIDDVLIMGVRI